MNEFDSRLGLNSGQNEKQGEINPRQSPSFPTQSHLGRRRHSHPQSLKLAAGIQFNIFSVLLTTIKSLYRLLLNAFLEGLRLL